MLFVIFIGFFCVGCFENEFSITLAFRLFLDILAWCTCCNTCGYTVKMPGSWLKISLYLELLQNHCMEPAKQCTSLIWFVYYQLYHLLFYYRTPSMQILKWSTVKLDRLRFFVSLYEFRILNYCEKSGCVMSLGITVAITFRLDIFSWFWSVQKLFLVSHPPLFTSVSRL